jgi:hypothetical protein
MTTIKDLINTFNIGIEIPDVWNHDLDDEYEYKYHSESVEYGKIKQENSNDGNNPIKKEGIIHVFSYPGTGRGAVQENEEDEIIIDLNNNLLTYIRADGTYTMFDDEGEIVLSTV